MSPAPATRRPPVIVILITALVAACSSITAQDAPGCSGARRPANPHGSVLAPEAKANTQAPAAGAWKCRGGRP